MLKKLLILIIIIEIILIPLIIISNDKKIIIKKVYTLKIEKKEQPIAKITIKLSLKVGTYKIYTSYGKSKITNTLKIKK